jgi:hypothetical protein
MSARPIPEQVLELRGWTPAAADRLGLGWDGERVVFPVRDQSGEQIGAVRYSPNGREPKMLAARGTTRELFPPPEDVADEELEGLLWLVEGEPDAVRVWSLGLAAVAVPGSGKWRDEWAARFAGRRCRVVVCFDCDVAGRRAAARVAQSLAEAGVDARVLDLWPDRVDGFDLTDYTAKARSADERGEARRLLVRMAERAPLASVRPRQGEDRRLDLRPLAAVRPRRVRWLKPGLIALRTLTLVAGVGGLGKSTWCAGVAADVSRGRLGDDPANVIIVSFEDTAEEVLRPRVEAANGDLHRVHEVIVGGQNGVEPVLLPRDLGELERLVREAEARFVVIDPIVAAIDTALDAHKDQHVRSVLARLARLAESAECAIALVGHLNKTPSREAYIRVANSVAFYNASRSVVLVTPDPEEPEQHRLVTQAKANYARLCPVERHVLEEIQLEAIDPRTGDPVITSRMRYLDDAGDVDRANVLAEPRAGRGEGQLGRAVVFLVNALADSDWHDSAGLNTLAGAQGISEPTLKRAAQELDVEHERRGFPSRTHWRLASRISPSPTGAEPTAGQAANPHGSRESQQAPLPVGSVGSEGIGDEPTEATTDAAERGERGDAR